MKANSNRAVKEEKEGEEGEEQPQPRTDIQHSTL